MFREKSILYVVVLSAKIQCDSFVCLLIIKKVS